MRLIRLLLFLAIAAAAAASIPALFPALIWQLPEAGPERATGDAGGGDAGSADPQRGAYLFAMAGCAGCHTSKGGTLLAGGREIASPFGVFVSPNITPDPETGIGGWTEADFRRAMTLGLSPDGRHYYPAFPYISYTRMTRADLRDLWAYLQTVPPVTSRTGGHRLAFPYSVRPGLGLWKLLFLTPGRYRPDPGRSRQWNRGAYIVTGPAHCGECHTRRNVLGGLRNSVHLAGAPDYGDGRTKIGGAPNITPHKTRGIGSWRPDDILFALETGVTPSGDVMGGEMEEVVSNVTSKLTDADRRAIVDYLRSVPAKALD